MRRFVAVSCVALSGCAGLQSPLNPAGDQAQSVAGLLTVMGWICGAMYGGVVTFLVAALWRAWRRPAHNAPDVEPPDTGLGRSLVVWAAVIVGGLFILITASFLVDRSFAAASAREAVVVRVTGHQWWWRLQYRTASGAWVETANELHLPVGRTARIELGSADVIHSFWVPNVAGKMDAVPGRTNVIDLSPRRAGWFRGQCAEFCGLQHAHMAFDVKVESQGDFDAWLASQARVADAPSNPVLQRGMTVVTGGQCAACHVVRGTAAVGRSGPDLTHIGARRSIAAGTLPFSRGALQGWITQPQAVKPGTMMPVVPLDPADADAVARYLESLK